MIQIKISNVSSKTRLVSNFKTSFKNKKKSREKENLNYKQDKTENVPIIIDQQKEILIL